MENSYRFKVTYNKQNVCYITARTEFEAIDKSYYANVVKNPNLVRKLFSAKKMR